MAQSGYTPISLYYSATGAAVPTSGNLVAGELAINTLDGKLYYKNSAGTVTLLASTTGASGDVVGPASSTDDALARFDLTTGKLIQNSVGILSDAGILTGLTGITSSGSITLSSLTSGRVTYAGTAGLLQDSANLLFNGTTLTANTIGAFTLSGTVAGGGNQLNNVIIGTANPLAGSFTTLGASGNITRTIATTTGYAFITNAGANAGAYTVYVDGTSTRIGNEIALPIDIQSNSTTIGRFSSTGLAVTGTLSATGTITNTPTANTNTLAFNSSTSGTGNNTIAIQNSGGQLVIRLDDSGGNSFGAGAYATGFQAPTPIVFSANSGTNFPFKINATSVAVTGTLSATSIATFGTSGATDTQLRLGPLDASNTYFQAISADGTTAKGYAFYTGSSEAMRLDSSGNLGIGTNSPAQKLDVVGSIKLTGSVIPATAGQGIDFTANTGAAGMTSELLNWYEEGTWTPSVTAQSGTYTTVTTQSGTYTRVGRQVTIRGSFNVTVKGTGAGGALVAGLPFTPANNIFVGIGVDRSTFVQQVAIVYFNTGNVYINTPAGGDGIVATNVQDFTATYFV